MSAKPIHKSPSLIALCVAAGIATFSAPALRAEVWRCGNSYSEQPCRDGRKVDARDGRSKAQQRDALRGAQSNAAVAAELAQRRRRAQAAQPAPILIGAPVAGPSAKPRIKSEKARRAKTERFVARDPRAVRKNENKMIRKAASAE